MTSVSEYELLRDKNIKEREALVSTEQVNSSSQVWIFLRKLLPTVFDIALHLFQSGHQVISVSFYHVEANKVGIGCHSAHHLHLLTHKYR
jgi:hypothetical protein